MNYIIKVGNRYIMGVMGIGIWKYPVTTGNIEYAYDFKDTVEAYAFIRDYKLKEPYVLDYAIERANLGISDGTKLRMGIGGRVRWK